MMILFLSFHLPVDSLGNPTNFFASIMTEVLKLPMLNGKLILLEIIAAVFFIVVNI